MNVTAKGTHTKWPLRWLLGTAAVIGVVSGTIARLLPTTSLRPDDFVVLFPTAAHLNDDGSAWIVPIHGWVFEPETDDPLRRAAIAAVTKAIGVEPSSVEATILGERLRPFLVDNKRNRLVTLRVAGYEHQLGPTDPQGHFVGEIRVAREVARGAMRSGGLDLEVVSSKHSSGVFRGRSLLLEPVGFSVISDIDDTVKVSHVLDKAELLKNTLLREFQAAPGMSELYRTFETQGAVFHYVSCSPWQLYPAITQFLRGNSFPESTFELKRFRLKDSSVGDFFAGPEVFKPRSIDALLRAFPKRRFGLIGDSGEKDPEIYGQIAREFPDQIAWIVIRNVTDESADSVRFVQAFRDLERTRWHLFTDPGTLRRLVPPVDP